VVRLTPRPERARSISRELRVSPQPIAQHERDDAYGNRVTELRFAGSCRELVIDSAFELETLPPPALARVLPGLPWPAPSQAELLDYCAVAPPDVEVRAFAQRLAAEVGEQPLAFLEHLMRTLYTRFDRHIRPTGHAKSAAQTLSSGSGACRDLAVLFLESCRCLGMPGRFVSGYQAEAESVDGQRHLHAWPEVCLPDTGFCGWDPTHGLRVGEGHVPLCAAPAQGETMPVEGGYTFEAREVTSTLDFSLHIETSR
jgi:transglutaminase-like putative cysteine protease